ncbi:MAG TPA: C39 family peptidase [Anaerolineae bacterium]|nr:C39 family peptidase [Anaerolineae bacterium]
MRHRKKLLLIIALAPVLLTILLGAAWFLWPGRDSPQAFSSSGGQAFAEKVVIDVPFFLQNDDRWAEEEIGDSGCRMGSEGCVITSVAMLINYYGIDTDPKRLNKYLSQNGGYTEEGRIYWNKVCEFSNGKVKLTYVGPGSYDIIDEHIRSGNPVIVKIYIYKVIPHWVLIVGKEGQEYFINDPAAADKKVRKLSDYDSDIYAVRIYEKKEQ